MSYNAISHIFYSTFLYPRDEYIIIYTPLFAKVRVYFIGKILHLEMNHASLQKNG